MSWGLVGTVKGVVGSVGILKVVMRTVWKVEGVMGIVRTVEGVWTVSAFWKVSGDLLKSLSSAISN